MHDFTILVLPGQFPTGVSVSRDVLMTAEMVASRLGMARPRWRICSLAGGVVPLQGGFSLDTTRLPRHEHDDRSVWISAGLGLNTADDVHRRLRDPDIIEMARRMRHHVETGGRVAAACSAVFMLQAAGLLADRRATTTWWLGPVLQELEPACRVDTDRMVRADGPLVTSGAAFAQTDLMMHLLRERFGSELVTAVSRLLLIDGRVAQQAPFIVPEVLASGNELVSRLTRRIEDALPDIPSVTVLASELCMSDRTLARHVSKSTVKSTYALIQSIRFRRARALLENSRMSMEQVAEAVGYRDPTALRKLVRKVTGVSPRQNRGIVYAADSAERTPITARPARSHPDR
ncbi:MAG: helix-turn-helix domain-containing protein [Perlucidibaca sp.]